MLPSEFGVKNKLSPVILIENTSNHSTFPSFFQINPSIQGVFCHYNYSNKLMLGSPSLQRELQTIQYIKTLVQPFQQQPLPSEQSHDSLIISESEPSQATIKLRLPKHSPPKEPRYAKRYVSPYKQANLSMRKIQASGRKPVSPEVSFSNTLLQIATSREKEANRQYETSSRYRASTSMMGKLEAAALDTIRVQARKMHQIQEKQRMEMTPRQRNEKWADFLLRERKWEEERRTREMEIRQKTYAQDQNLSNKALDRQKYVPRITREDLVRKVKRQKSKLQERLRQVSQNSYKYKNVNIRGERHSSIKKPQATSSKLVITDPRDALFLVEHP